MYCIMGNFHILYMVETFAHLTITFYYFLLCKKMQFFPFHIFEYVYFSFFHVHRVVALVGGRGWCWGWFWGWCCIHLNPFDTLAGPRERLSACINPFTNSCRVAMHHYMATRSLTVFMQNDSRYEGVCRNAGTCILLSAPKSICFVWNVREQLLYSRRTQLCTVSTIANKAACTQCYSSECMTCSHTMHIHTKQRYQHHLPDRQYKRAR